MIRVSHPNTPRCSGCGRKFSGDPCVECADDMVFAEAQRRVDVNAAWDLWDSRSQRMPSATRRRRKHGR